MGLYQQPHYQKQPPPQPPPSVYPEKNYTTNAVVVMLLYLLLYIPGLIANVAYLMDALETKRRLGYSPQGLGCLQALILFQLVPLVIFIVAVIASAAAGGH